MLAYQLGWISGNGEGSFEGNENLKLLQATKIIVAALGYPNQAFSDTLQYYLKAQNLGLLKNIKQAPEDELSGYQIIMLLYNALDVPILEAIGFGSKLTFSNRGGKTLLGLLGYVKHTGILNGNSVTRLSYSTYMDKGKIQIEGAVLKEGELDTRQLLGANVVAYAKINEQALESDVTVYIEQRKYWNDELIIQAEDAVVTQSSISTRDGRTKGTVSRTADIIFNAVAAPDFDLTSYTINEGEYRLLDNNADGIYDVVFVNDYCSYLVESVDRTGNKLHANDGAYELELTPDLLSDQFCILKNGVEIKLSDIKVNDVVSVTLAVRETADTYTQVFVSETQASGTIDEIILDKDSQKLVVDGETYQLSRFVYLTDSLSPGDEATFYLSVLGKVVGVSRKVSSANQYGYVIGVNTKSTLSNSIQLKLLTAENTQEIIDTADQIRFNNNRIAAKKLLSDANRPLWLGEIIMYTTNNRQEITSIMTKQADGNETKLKLSAPLARRNYNANNGVFFETGVISSTHFVSRNALVFIVPSDVNSADDKLFYTRTTAFLKGSTAYDIELYNSDSFGEASIVLVRRDSKREVLSGAKPVLVDKVVKT